MIKLIKPYNVPCVQLITNVNTKHGMFITLGRPNLNEWGVVFSKLKGGYVAICRLTFWIDI